MEVVANEQQPLLAPTTQDHEHALIPEHDEVLLDFENGDNDNPKEWTVGFKWCIVLLLASMAFTVYITPTFLSW
jgi:hypothetical protein